jgi:hypothetical protein
MALYEEEYQTATPLIASLLWGLPDEPTDALLKQLKALNTQIRRKNSHAKRQQNEGVIDVDLLPLLRNQIQEAARSDKGPDEKLFLQTQADLQEAISLAKWPKTWNIELDQFREYCAALADDNVSNIESTQDSSSSTEESELSDLDELFDEDLMDWQIAVPLDIIRHKAEKTHGIPFMPGPILGWSGDERSGYSLIIGSQCQGKKIARVMRSTYLPAHLDDSMSIELNTRAHRQVDGVTYDSKVIDGVGLVAWKVGGKHELDPTLSLHPGTTTSYPEAYVWVQWYDGVWTWETREDFHAIMYELTSLQVDLLLYQLATSQDAEYREKLTGERPIYREVLASDLKDSDSQTCKSYSKHSENSDPLDMKRKLSRTMEDPFQLSSIDSQVSFNPPASKVNNSLKRNPNNQNVSNTTSRPALQIQTGTRYTPPKREAQLLGVLNDDRGRNRPRRGISGRARGNQ